MRDAAGLYTTPSFSTQSAASFRTHHESWSVSGLMRYDTKCRRDTFELREFDASEGCEACAYVQSFVLDGTDFLVARSLSTTTPEFRYQFLEKILFVNHLWAGRRQCLRVQSRHALDLNPFHTRTVQHSPTQNRTKKSRVY